MKEMEAKLNALCDRNRGVKRAALKQLEDYIRKRGEIDWTENECKVETTFYGNGYYTAEVIKVSIDENVDKLVILTSAGYVIDFDGGITNDTILDILCSVIGNASVAERRKRPFAANECCR